MILKQRDPKFKHERNKSIWQDRCDGMTYKDIAKKYGVTMSRVRDIYEDYDRHNNTEAWKKRNGFVYY